MIPSPAEQKGFDLEQNILDKIPMNALKESQVELSALLSKNSTHWRAPHLARIKLLIDIVFREGKQYISLLRQAYTCSAYEILQILINKFERAGQLQAALAVEDIDDFNLLEAALADHDLVASKYLYEAHMRLQMPRKFELGMFVRTDPVILVQLCRNEREPGKEKKMFDWISENTRTNRAALQAEIKKSNQESRSDTPQAYERKQEQKPLVWDIDTCELFPVSYLITRFEKSIMSPRNSLSERYPLSNFLYKTRYMGGPLLNQVYKRPLLLQRLREYMGYERWLYLYKHYYAYVYRRLLVKEINDQQLANLLNTFRDVPPKLQDELHTLLECHLICNYKALDILDAICLKGYEQSYLAYKKLVGKKRAVLLLGRMRGDRASPIYEASSRQAFAMICKHESRAVVKQALIQGNNGYGGVYNAFATLNPQLIAIYIDSLTEEELAQRVRANSKMSVVFLQQAMNQLNTSNEKTFHGLLSLVLSALNHQDTRQALVEVLLFVYKQFNIKPVQYFNCFNVVVFTLVELDFNLTQQDAVTYAYKEQIAINRINVYLECMRQACLPAERVSVMRSPRLFSIPKRKDARIVSPSVDEDTPPKATRRECGY